MSSTPRIIASTASAALLAATGAGAAVLAVDIVNAGANQTVEASTTESLNPAQDDRTTVYRSPQDNSDDHGESDDHGASSSTIQPAPPSTSFQGGTTQQGPANTSKSS